MGEKGGSEASGIATLPSSFAFKYYKSVTHYTFSLRERYRSPHRKPSGLPVGMQASGPPAHIAQEQAGRKKEGVCRGTGRFPHEED